MGSRFRMAFYWDWVSIPSDLNKSLNVHLVSGAHFCGHPLVNWPFRMFCWPFQWIIISFIQDLMDLLLGMSANSFLFFILIDHGHFFRLWIINGDICSRLGLFCLATSSFLVAAQAWWGPEVCAPHLMCSCLTTSSLCLCCWTGWRPEVS